MCLTGFWLFEWTPIDGALASIFCLYDSLSVFGFLLNWPPYDSALLIGGIFKFSDKAYFPLS